MDNLLLIAIIISALWYDFVNGFHDAANAIATVIKTHALSPRTAILLARTLNFLGALSHTAVAYTIGKGVVTSEAITMPIILGAVLGAIIWGYLTWWLGLPSSSTHALVGGLIGVSLYVYHFDWSVLMLGGIKMILLIMIISPFIGMVGGAILIALFSWSTKNLPHDRSNKFFKKLQVASASFVSFTHGMNDAQNGMGIIAIALLSAGAIQQFHVPFWVRLLSALAIGLGTSVGGWRIIHTMGDKITRLEPKDGCAAETAAGTDILFNALLGVPSSTTHITNGAIFGVGMAHRLSGVNWRVIRNISTAWVLTFPGAGLSGILAYLATNWLFK